MKGSRRRISDRDYAEQRQKLKQQQAEALEQSLSLIARQIASSVTNPGDAAQECRKASRFHALDEDSTWRLIEKVMTVLHGHAPPCQH